MLRSSWLVVICALLVVVACKTSQSKRDADLARLASASGVLLTAEVRADFEAAEQTCIPATDDLRDEAAEIQSLKLDEIALQLEDRFKNLGMLERTEAPKSWDEKAWANSQDDAPWKAEIKRVSDAERCQLLETAYVFAAWRLATTPSAGSGAQALVRDRAQAKWALRFAYLTPQSMYPPACQALRAEVDARWSFVATAAQPLGFVGTSCLRPASATYLDADVRSGKRPKPAAWVD